MTPANAAPATSTSAPSATATVTATPAPADGAALPAFSRARRIVVKVGSSLVTNRGQGLDREALARWASQIARLRADGREIVLVSSGAIAEGMQRLGWSKRPSALHELQAAAAVGQMGLAQVYESCFREHGLLTSQILLTHEDLADRRRYLNARTTLITLLGLGVIPIINENDTVTTEEIKLGDNDTLASLVTNLIEAEALVILTDQAGIFSGDPRVDPSATLLATARAGDPHLESIAGGVGSAIARGGMLTKVLAAKRAARSGACTIVASGEEADVLVRLAAGEAIGTLLVPDTAPMAARKQWLADQLQVRGQVTLDAGAVRALQVEGKSLLPIGATAVSGDFDRGELVRCIGPDGAEIARGLANYPSSEVARILGVRSGDIEARLGYVVEPELIHRDNLVVTAQP